MTKENEEKRRKLLASLVDPAPSEAEVKDAREFMEAVALSARARELGPELAVPALLHVVVTTAEYLHVPLGHILSFTAGAYQAAKEARGNAG